MGRLRPPTPPPDQVHGGQQGSLRIRREPCRFMRGRSPIADRFEFIKLALLDRHILRGGNAKRPLVPTVTPFGGGSGEADRPPTGGYGGKLPLRFGFISHRNGQNPISTKGCGSFASTALFVWIESKLSLALCLCTANHLKNFLSNCGLTRLVVRLR